MEKMEKSDQGDCSNTNTEQKWKHSNRIYALLRYNYLIFPLTLLLTFYVARKIIRATGVYYVDATEDGSWHRTATIHAILSILLLLCQLPPYANTLGLCLPMRPDKHSTKPKRRTFRTLRVCLVTKGTNLQTALNSASCWERLEQRSHPSIKFHVLVDGENGAELKPRLPSFVTVDCVPVDLKFEKAKYKARAFEYFRLKYNFSKEDWVLHLDEESEIDDRVIEKSLEFIERGTADFGMGTILYTSTNHWDKILPSAIEVSRVAEDFGRFQLPVLLFRRPLLGWTHGSWSLINGEVENTVTWETENICEDYWVGYHAASRGFKFEWIHAIFREQPPLTIMDFWKQRRRWYTGICHMDSAKCRYALLLTGIGSLGVLMFPIMRIFGLRINAPRWYFEWMLFNDAAGIHLFLVGSVLQDLSVEDLSFARILYHAVASVVLSPVVHVLQALALISAVIVPSKGWVIIDKK